MGGRMGEWMGASMGGTLIRPFGVLEFLSRSNLKCDDTKFGSQMIDLDK